MSSRKRAVESARGAAARGKRRSASRSLAAAGASLEPSLWKQVLGESAACQSAQEHAIAARTGEREESKGQRARSPSARSDLDQVARLAAHPLAALTARSSPSGAPTTAPAHSQLACARAECAHTRSDELPAARFSSALAPSGRELAQPPAPSGGLRAGREALRAACRAALAEARSRAVLASPAPHSLDDDLDADHHDNHAGIRARHPDLAATCTDNREARHGRAGAHRPRQVAGAQGGARRRPPARRHGRRLLVRPLPRVLPLNVS